MEGWIKTHRKMLEWEWYDDANCFRVFMHLLLIANHKDNRWRGRLILRGQHLTSLGRLAKDTGLTVSKVRTAISKLESTGEIASESHTQDTVFTIKNYDYYQCSDTALAHQPQADDKPLAIESQADDKALATNKNDKKDKNNQEEKEISNLPAKADNPKSELNLSPFFSIGFTESQVSEVWQIRKANKGKPIKTQRVINGLAKEFSEAVNGGMTIESILNEWATRGWQSFKAEWVLKNLGQPQQKAKWDNTDALAGEFENMLNSGDINL